MKKITKLTVGVLAFAMFGLTSCVQDDVTPEVKAIYQNQAGLLAAQTSLKQAEVAVKQAEAQIKAQEAKLKEAQVKAQELNNKLLETKNESERAKLESLKAKSEKEIQKYKNELAESQRELELDKIKHLKAIFEANDEVRKAKVTLAKDYSAKYTASLVKIADKEQELLEKNRKIDSLKGDKQKVIDANQAIAGKEREIASQEKAIEEQKEEIANLEAILKDPSTAENKILALQKKKDSLQGVIDDLGAKATDCQTKLNKFDDVQNYSQELQNYKGLQFVMTGDDATIAGHVKDSTDAADKLQEYADEYEVDNSPEGLAEFIKKAQVKATELQDKLDQANATKTYYDDLVSDYSDAIDARVAALTTIANSQTTLSTAVADSTRYANIYTQAKSLFDANPTGYYSDINNGSANADGKLGEYDDNPTTTSSYYLVTAVSGSGTASFGAGPYDDLSAIQADFPNATTGSMTSTSGSPAVNEFWDVENDDDVKKISVILQTAEANYNNNKDATNNARNQLAAAQSDLADAEAKIAEFDIATINSSLLEATQARDAAQQAVNDHNDLFNVIADVQAQVTKLADATQAAAEARQDKADNAATLALMKKNLDRLEALITPEGLAEYKEILDKAKQIQLDVVENQQMKSDIDRQIALIEGIAGMLKVIDTSDSHDDNVEAVEDLIETKKAALITAEEELEDLNNDLAVLKTDGVNVQAQIDAEIARCEAKIKELEAEIAAEKALAAEYKAAMENALNS